MSELRHELWLRSVSSGWEMRRLWGRGDPIHVHGSQAGRSWAAAGVTRKPSQPQKALLSRVTAVSLRTSEPTKLLQPCPDSLQPHGLQPTRLLWPWGFSRQECRSGLPWLLWLPHRKANHSWSDQGGGSLQTPLGKYRPGAAGFHAGSQLKLQVVRFCSRPRYTIPNPQKPTQVLPAPEWRQTLFLCSKTCLRSRLTFQGT